MLTSAVRKATPISTYRTFASLASAGSGIVADGSGNVYVALPAGNIIIKATYPGATITTFAGSGSAGSANGTGVSASFNSPGPLAIDSSSNLYVGDTNNNTVRKITTGQVVTTIPFSVTGITRIAVSPDGSNIAAVDSSSYVHYYIAGVDLGKATPTPSYPLTNAVGCRPDGVFYRAPSSNNGTVPGLVRLSVSSGTTSETTVGKVNLVLVSGTTYQVTMTGSGTQLFASGTVVSFSGFTPSSLNITGVTLAAATTTGNGGTIAYQYNFGQSMLTQYTTTGTVFVSGAIETPTAITLDGSGLGNYSSNIVFVSQTRAMLARDAGPAIYTFSGDTAVSNATTGLTGITNVVVKNVTFPEILYTSSGSNSINLFAKQY